MSSLIKSNEFSCYFVGDDNLTLQCAEIVLEKNHKILGIISKSPKIQFWCLTHSIPCIHNFQELAKNKTSEFDYLFSVVNSEMLPKELLALPKQWAINYHNSPLPKYAGLYATTWAILNNEKEHAISWHIMDEKIDSGSILKQTSFLIGDDDTALDLNLKCYEHAIKAFRELVDELATKTATPKSQNLSTRTYYGLRNKPTNFGFISWNQPAENIDRMCRALFLGKYNNELATPKIIINDEIFIIKAHKKLNTSSGLKPGTILDNSDEMLQISTLTTDIAILQLTDVYGKNCPINTLIQQCKLINKSQLDLINIELVKKLSSSPAGCPKVEQFWVKEFIKCSEKCTFLPSFNPRKNNLYPKRQNLTDIPLQVIDQLKKVGFPSTNLPTILLTTLLIYLYRLNNYKNLSVRISTKELRSDNHGLDNFLSNDVPLTSPFKYNHTFIEALTIVSETLAKLIQNKTYAKDIFIRYPELISVQDKIEIGIIFGSSQDTTHCSKNKINFLLTEDCSAFSVLNSAEDGANTSSFAFLEAIEEQALTLVANIARNPNAKLFEFSIISSEEKNRLLVEWNNTSATYDYKKSIHLYFEEQVKKNPDSVAIIFEDHSLTYEELNQKSNQLAHYLRAKKVKPNELIGICLNRSIEMVICIIGVLKSGAAFVPLDPNYPEERLAYMISNSQMHILLTELNLINKKIERYDKTILEVNKFLKKNKSSIENLEYINKGADLAYVIYTSGSTGVPKGVSIPHQALCNHMLWMESEYAFNKNDVFLLKTSFSFDASLWEFFMPLLVGATLVVAPNQAHTSSKQIVNLVQKHRVNVIQLVPSMLKEVVATDGFHACTSLKHLFCGGEALLPASIREFFKNNAMNAALHNLYGPTENTIDSVTHTCLEEDGLSEVSLIGKPIKNTHAYVLDEHMQPMPVGVIGELYLSGAGLAHGYLNNLPISKQKFFPNPFGPNKDSRIYKTGDLAKWNSFGELEYHGRCDNQIKVRGYRIELNEIESVIDKISFIRQCIVLPETSKNGSLSLSAYLVVDSDIKFFTSQIRDQLLHHLPEYMIPSRYFVVEKFFTTPGGKIDRIHLPKPLFQVGMDENHINHNKELEHSLQDIWCSVLKIDEVGVYEDFFDLGGNSMSAMNMISLIKEKLGITITTRMLFDFPTIHRLSQEIDNHAGIYTRPKNFYHHIVSIKPQGTKSPIFLIHPVGGGIFWYNDLARYIDNDIPVYGMQDPGLEEQKLLFECLEDMARLYIDAIQTIQPKGPYIIGGASFGTTVAVEMAKQLEGLGEHVTCILSLDGWAHYPTLQHDEAYFRTIMQTQNERLLEKYHSNNISNPNFLLELQWHRERMLTEYKLPLIKTKFILFKANEPSEPFPYPAPLNWWEYFTKYPIELHTVQGDHISMFSEPYIQTLAKKMNVVLRNILNPSPLVEDQAQPL